MAKHLARDGAVTVATIAPAALSPSADKAARKNALPKQGLETKDARRPVVKMIGKRSTEMPMIMDFATLNATKQSVVEIRGRLEIFAQMMETVTKARELHRGIGVRIVAKGRKARWLRLGTGAQVKAGKEWMQQSEMLAPVIAGKAVLHPAAVRRAAVIRGVLLVAQSESIAMSKQTATAMHA